MAANYVPASGALVSNIGNSVSSPLDLPTSNLDNADSTFHPFPKLPLELRNLIWGYAIYFTTNEPPCALLSVTKKARHIATNIVWAWLPTNRDEAHIQYDPDVTTLYITNFRELLDSVEFDDTHPEELVDWFCPSAFSGENIGQLAVDICHIYYPIRHHPRGVWHELVWVSLLRKMFPQLTTIMIVTDPKNTGLVFNDAYLAIHKGGDEYLCETEDEGEDRDKNEVYSSP
ncbi:hypothetical protein DL95DRAFT_510056 [Leptodontidium sp. 2 PMI_412]|nr:hypothetical protein DL95DRAFT_510056 [Leptodontidium sp. 2 PMI_412]